MVIGHSEVGLADRQRNHGLAPGANDSAVPAQADLDTRVPVTGTGALIPGTRFALALRQRRRRSSAKKESTAHGSPVDQDRAAAAGSVEPQAHGPAPVGHPAGPRGDPLGAQAPGAVARPAERVSKPLDMLANVPSLAGRWRVAEAVASVPRRARRAAARGMGPAVHRRNHAQREGDAAQAGGGTKYSARMVAPHGQGVSLRGGHSRGTPTR